MFLSIRMRVIYNVKDRYAIRYASLTKLVLESKAIICSTIKKFTFILLQIFGIYFRCHNNNETPLAIETINFTIESLAFNTRHLNGAHSMWHSPSSSDVVLKFSKHCFLSILYVPFSSVNLRLVTTNKLWRFVFLI